MENKRVFIIKGRKWLDKVNGNTYNSAKVIDVNTDLVVRVPLEYGYGADYYYRAIEEIKHIIGGEIDYKKIYIYDAGADYDKRLMLKTLIIKGSEKTAADTLNHCTA